MLFKKVIAGTLYCVYKNRTALAKALSLPFIVFLMLGFLETSEVSVGVSYLLIVLSAFVQVIFAITTHRVVLLGKASVPEWGLRSWSKRETFYFLHAVGLLLMLLAPALLSFVPLVGAAVAFVIIFWVWCRVSLVFPGIAVDKGVSFEMSWNMTKDYQLLMFLVVVICPALLAIPSVLLSFIPHTFILTNFLSTLVIVFEVAALSMTYQLITSERYANA